VTPPFPINPSHPTTVHGTGIAGVIAATADNGFGVRGIAPEASLISVKVLSKDPRRNTPWSRIAEAFDWASSSGRADIINASLGVHLDDSDPADREQISNFLGIANRLTAHVVRRGVAIFAAAGNQHLNVSDAPDLKIWPAQAPRVVAAGATGPCGAALDGNLLNDYYDNLTSNSNYGFDQGESLFLVFPGGEPSWCKGGTGPGPTCTVGGPAGLLSVRCFRFDQTVTTGPMGTGVTPTGQPGGNYLTTAQTSASTAHATGLAALILSRYPDMRVGQLLDTILNTATDLGPPGYDPQFGYGRGDASWLQ
jgi:subtilisin family serine protease